MTDKEHTKVMIVDGRGDLGSRVSGLFPENGTEVASVGDVDKVLERFSSETFDVLVVDGESAVGGSDKLIKQLETIASHCVGTRILFLAGDDRIEDAVSALKAGSWHYVRLPVSDKELRLLIQTAADGRPRHSSNLLLDGASRESRLGELVGKSPVMRELYGQIRQAGGSDIPVLLSGETGTGKDLAARAIHHRSARNGGPFVPVHLGALPSELVSSELFGYEKGAFTGALDKREGKFEQAHTGTIFLDEIGTIDEKVQVTLLRVIEQKKFHRLGGRKKRSTNARIVAATNQDLFEAVENGSFREDLFYRLEVFHVHIPPLRERSGDIQLLVDEFIKRYNRTYQKNVAGISGECMAALEGYDWPGNVRELKNVIQRAVLVCGDEVISVEHLPPRFRDGRENAPKISVQVGSPLADIEREAIQRTLAFTNNNRKKTAEILGISRRAIYNKLKRYGLE